MMLRDRQLEGLIAHLIRHARRRPGYMIDFYRARSEGARQVIMERAGVPADDTLWVEALTQVGREVA